MSRTEEGVCLIDATNEKDGAYAGPLFCQATSIAASYHVQAATLIRCVIPPHVYMDAALERYNTVDQISRRFTLPEITVQSKTQTLRRSRISLQISLRPMGSLTELLELMRVSLVARSCSSSSDCKCLVSHKLIQPDLCNRSLPMVDESCQPIGTT